MKLIGDETEFSDPRLGLFLLHQEKNFFWSSDFSLISRLKNFYFSKKNFVTVFFVKT